MPENPQSRFLIGAFVLGLAFAGGTFLLARQAYVTHQPSAPLQRPHLLLGKVIENGPFELRIEGIGERAGHTYAVIYGGQTRFLRLVPWMPGEREQAQNVHEKYMMGRSATSTEPAPPPPLSMNVILATPKDVPVGTPVGIISNDVIPLAASTPAIAEVVRPLLPDEASEGSVATSFPFR